MVLYEVTLPVVALLRVALFPFRAVMVVPIVILAPLIEEPTDTPSADARVSVVLPLPTVEVVIVVPDAESTMAPAISPKPLPPRTSVLKP